MATIKIDEHFIKLIDHGISVSLHHGKGLLGRPYVFIENNTEPITDSKLVSSTLVSGNVQVVLVYPQDTETR